MSTATTLPQSSPPPSYSRTDALKELIKTKIDLIDDPIRLDVIETIIEALVDYGPLASARGASSAGVVEIDRAADEVLVEGRGIPQGEMERLYGLR